MSILLPEIDDATAANRLRSLQSSIRGLEIDLEQLSTQQHLLRNKRDTLHRSKSEQQVTILERWLPKTCTKKSCSDSVLESVHEALQDIDSRLQVIHQRHRRLSFSLEIYKEILAPISRVPCEVLEQIFLHTLPPGFVKPSTRQSPLLLTAVCRKWRSIALSTPLLWSSLSTTSDWPLRVFLPQLLPSLSEKLTRLITGRPSETLPSQPLLWIERAGRAPFCMEITIPKKDYWFGIADPYYHWVVQTSERWFHLRLTARSANLALLLSKPMPKLETLELIAIYDRSYDIFMLRTHYAEFNLHPETFSFPWSSLTTLEAPETWIIVDQLVTILNGSPNLRSCRARVQDIYSVEDVPYFIKHHITHPSLVSFHIFMNLSYPLRRLLDSLTLSSLRELRIATLKDPIRSDWPHAAFLNFARRSQCPLRTLYLAGLSMSPQTGVGWRDPDRMKEIWSNLPSLRSFELV